MESLVISRSFSITGQDVLYVGQQIQLDLLALSKAYPKIISSDYAVELFISYTTFLVNNAVSDIGFSIYDPAKKNVVYHEYRYKVVLGVDVTSVTDGNRRGTRREPVQAVPVTSSAAFTPWVRWSTTMLNLSSEQQKNIVSSTKWSIPGRTPPFEGRYEGGNWSSLGLYASGNLGVDGQIFQI